MQTDLFANDASPDHDERIQEFLARHGGASDDPPREHRDASGLSGWSEVQAADGYRLRRDWSRFGEGAEMKFSELSPNAPQES